MPILLKSLLFGKENLRERSAPARIVISGHCNCEKKRYNAFVAYAAVERRETHIQEDTLMKKYSLLSFVTVLLALSTLQGCGYNTMQANEEAVKAAWGDVESSYQRRADLVPNLVETVKAYAKHERETLTAVTEARSKAGSITLTKEMLDDPQALARFQQAQGALSSSLSRLMVVVEKYPDLKANQGFQDLAHQLEGTENRINVARSRYNKAVETFNTSIRIFPNSLTNSMLLHLKLKEPFKADEGAATAPKVKFQ
jgi:LemA protein